MLCAATHRSQERLPNEGAMPIHDWTRVDDGIFHSFHTAWIGDLVKTFNNGLLPSDYYALGEQVAGGLGPDALTLQTPLRGDRPALLPGAVAVAQTPPRVRLTFHPEKAAYTRRQRSLAIRHTSGHQLVALVEIVSPGNKSSQQALRSFLDKAAAALARGIHLLVLDLLPPGRRDPQGIHGALWDNLAGDTYQQPADKPLTLAAYVAEALPIAYVEPVAVGDQLPDMPLFLDCDQYVNVPLEATYQAAYASVPRFYRTILEASST